MFLLTNFSLCQKCPFIINLSDCSKSIFFSDPQEEIIVPSRCCDVIYTYLSCDLNNNQSLIICPCYIKSLRAGTASFPPLWFPPLAPMSVQVEKGVREKIMKEEWQTVTWKGREFRIRHFAKLSLSAKALPHQSDWYKETEVCLWLAC